MDRWAGRHGIECVYLLARSDDPATAHEAEAAGFRLMDVRVTLRRAAERSGPDMAVRESRPDDVPELAAIARVSHRQTRFYADPRFPPGRCDDLYAVWIERSCAGWADVVLVAERDGELAGYVSCHVDESARHGSIGLIAVADSARNRGVGRALVESAVAWCAERGLADVAVATQARSLAALRLYERCGFSIDSVGLWFHKWYGNDSG